MVILGHGCDEALVTSEGALVSFDYIRNFGDGRDLFRSKKKKFVSEHGAHAIRLFIFDVCRGGEYAVVKKVQPISKGNQFSVWKPTHVNVLSNICTLYSVPRGYPAADQQVFMNTVKDVVEEIYGVSDQQMVMDTVSEKTSILNEKEKLDHIPAIDEICMRIRRKIANRTKEYWLPQYETNNQFKIKLQRNESKEIHVEWFEVEQTNIPDIEGYFDSVSEYKARPRAIFEKVVNSVSSLFVQYPYICAYPQGGLFVAGICDFWVHL